MKVVSVINYKGGVGKTILTANLGAYAASQGKRVLLIDIDPQTHLTFSFMTPEYWRDNYANSKKTLKTYFEGVKKQADIPPLSSLVIPVNKTLENAKLDLISSHLELINIDVELAGLATGPTIEILARNSLRIHSYLRNELETMRDDYDLVLIDCPPNFYVMVKNAILASDCYIVPAKLDYLSTLGIVELEKKIANYLDEYAEYRNILSEENYPPVNPNMLGVVPMMVDITKGEPIAAQQAYKEELIKLNYYIFKFVRNNSSVFGTYPKDGVPAVLTRPRFSLTAKRIISELKELGDEFLEKLEI